MPTGIQILGPSGEPIVNLADRLQRVIQIIGVGGNGSFSHAGLSTGAPFAIFQPYGLGINSTMPVFSFSGSTFSWSFNGPTSSGYFVVGVY